MAVDLVGLRWWRIVPAAIAAFLGSLLVTILIVTGYAFALGVQVRGAPDSTKIAALGSTLRLSLGCLMAGRLGLELRRTPSGKRVTFGPGEEIVSDWLAEHALVTFHVVPDPWRFEQRVIGAQSFPLNLEYNEAHEFHRVLSGLWSAAKKQAAAAACWQT